ncbi:mechanosensitive ion channel family protein [Egbenema bharatensis]|uniref:mechanosensitive ion channel family protein n=1 Tax=Egbenema bharatensis TaxID=3463334 RepID=UPI003A856955
MILLAARPFRLNDQVVIGEHEGTVIQVKLRTTTIQTYDGRMVSIPNQSVFNRSIINNTASTARRSHVMLGIDYKADIATAQQVIKTALDRLETVENTPEPIVLVRELATSTVNLEVRFWVNSRRREFLQVTSEAIQAMKEGLQAAGIEMPTEIYTLTFRNPQRIEMISGEPGSNDRTTERNEGDNEGRSTEGNTDRNNQPNNYQTSSRDFSDPARS